MLCRFTSDANFNNDSRIVSTKLRSSRISRTPDIVASTFAFVTLNIRMRAAYRRDRAADMGAAPFAKANVETFLSVRASSLSGGIGEVLPSRVVTWESNVPYQSRRLQPL